MAVYLDFKDAIIRYGKIEAGKTGLESADDNTIYSLGKKVVEEKNMATCLKCMKR